ncbi:MAG: HAD hydrolase family protein [[Clostridium] innocuum]
MHKLEKKVILIDVDGTLVDYENHLPPSAVKAIRMDRALGHLVYICTGRSRSEVYDEIWNIGLDGMIGANGGYIEHHGEVLFHAHLKKEQCSAIVDWLHSRNLEFYLESNTGMPVNILKKRENPLCRNICSARETGRRISIYAHSIRIWCLEKICIGRM